jgi:hypothetical protein
VVQFNVTLGCGYATLGFSDYWASGDAYSTVLKRPLLHFQKNSNLFYRTTGCVR